MKNSAWWIGVAMGILFAVGGRANGGPVLDYWLTDGDSHRIYDVRGNAIVRTITTGSQPDHEYPIAVGDTIRTYAGAQGYYGREYLPDGTLTGSTYMNPGGHDYTWDGTTDGVSYNYALPQGSGDVVRYDRNWANGTTLFHLADLQYDTEWGGITYDTTNNSIWVNRRGASGEFRDYSLTGTLLSSFTLAGQSSNWGLAYEQSSDSLWSLGTTNSNGYWSILNIAKNGTLLSSTTIDGLQGNILGGEMRIEQSAIATPEPSTIVSASIAGLLGIGYAWRRRKAKVAA